MSDDKEYTVSRVVSLTSLTEKIETILGDNHPISIRFRQAAEERDPDLMEEAMTLLDEAPEDVRMSVHEVVVAWLLGGDDPEDYDLLNMPSPSTMKH